MYKISKLGSGLEIISAPMAGTKTATVLFMAATGSRFEKRADNGLSHFLEHLFFKGTTKRPTTLAIASELDNAGGEYNAFTGKEYTGYYIKVAANKLSLALDVLADLLLNSRFAAKEIEREKGVVIEELNMYLDNPLYYIEDLFENCLYGDTPAGRDTVGSKKTIANFSRGQVLNYYASQYSASEAVICLSGKVGPAAVKLAAGYFKKFSVRQPAENYKGKAPTDDRQAGPKINLHFKKTDQAHLSLGVRALPYGHDDELAVKILSLILGGSMSSRLFISLRERSGLAYYVRTHHQAYTDSGYLTAQAGVPVGKLAQAVKIILDEYRKLAAEPVGRTELDKAKQCLIGRLAIELETSDNLASWYARQAMLLKEQESGEEILTPEKYFARLKQVSAADLSRVARKIFAGNKLNLAVIGPYEEEVEIEKLLKF